MSRDRTKSFNIHIVGLYVSSTPEKHVEEYKMLKFT